jgi:DNA-binding beta-propeller fold protein YncE
MLERARWKTILAIASVGLLALASPGSAGWAFHYVTGWGTLGTGDGEFDSPWGLGIDPDGRVVVADTFNDRIQVFSAVGDFIDSFGSSGTAEYQFDWPAGLAIDQNGNIFVADRQNLRVQKYDKNGNFLLMFGAGVVSGLLVPEICTSACLVGLSSGADGGFSLPEGVAIGPSQSVYVTDYFGDRIQRFTTAGVFLNKFGISGDGKLNNPISIAVDQMDDVYVGDSLNFRIVKYSASGAFLRTWGWGVQDGTEEFQICTSGCQSGSSGNGAGQFHSMWAITVDPQRSLVYVAENIYSYLQVFTLDGSYLGRWGVLGSDPGQLDHPKGLDFDSTGRLFVAESANDRVQKFRYPLDAFVAEASAHPFFIDSSSRRPKAHRFQKR